MPTSRLRARITVAACSLAAIVAAAPAAAESATTPKHAVTPAPVNELLLLVTVNAQTADEAEIVLRSADGRWWLSAASLASWRLRAPGSGASSYAGVMYYPLDGLARTSVRFDPVGEQLTVTAPPEAFLATTVASQDAARAPPAPLATGGFLNYEFFASRADRDTNLAGQFEAGWFTPAGVFVSSALAQRNDTQRSALRLESTWTTDFPAQLASLRLGDAIGVPGAWGRAVRFGGIQYATNFGTQPGFVTFPEITASGQAALPSVVDVFVNNALVAQRSVPPGPFSINNVPTVTGGGQVQLVVRDLFGREQMITRPFYASSDLLAPGLAQFAYEGGFERRNFGVEGSDYGPAFGAVTYRRGISNELTLETRGEAARTQGAAGVAATWLWHSVGVLSGALAGSGGRDGGGTLASVGFERDVDRLSVTANAQWASREFRQLGDTPDNPAPKQQASGTIGYQFGVAGSANLTYVRQTYRSATGVELASLGYTVSLGRFGVLSLSAIRIFGANGSRVTVATVSLPWGDRSLASVGYERARGGGEDRDTTTLIAQRGLPAGPGFGYRVLARGSSDVQAGLAYQTNAGTYAFDATRFDGHDGMRASVAGGIGVVGGHPFVAREVTDSFGVVRVDDYPGIGVLLDNQVVGRTGQDGYAVLPRLRAYDRNRVSIDQRDLPLDATIDALSIEAIPYFRSGVLFDFPARRSHGATLHIVLDDGGDLPSGAYVEVDGRPEHFPVALDGEAYVTGLAAHDRLHATWRDRHCDFDVAMPVTHEPVPHLGTYVCHGVAR